MFSYLDTVRKLVDDAIYGRGIKYFLDSRVVSHTDLILDYWRIYKVVGKTEYEIKIPLIHLALSKEKFVKSHQALEEVVNCNCHYFSEYGACKHIVAVCASLENEFKLGTKTSELKNSQKIDSILEQMFEAENKKTHQKWLTEFEKYLNKNIEVYTWDWHRRIDFWQRVALEINKNKNIHLDFLAALKKITTEKITTWEGEKKLTLVFSESISFGSKLWLDLWQDFIGELVEDNKVKFWLQIWIAKWNGQMKDISREIASLLKNLDLELKNKILANLQNDFKEQKEIWIEFAIESENRQWLIENLNYFDPINLLRLTKILPEKQDEIENKLLNQIKIWSDFLQPGNYGEVAQALSQWQKQLDRSEMYELAITYIKENHQKKKKLIEILNKL